MKFILFKLILASMLFGSLPCIAAPSQPDFCIVLVDSLRSDHLGCYGYERDTSPAVDAFAEGPVRFDQAIASGSWTQPSIMSMMASVPADVHQRIHWGRPHSTNVLTLADSLPDAQDATQSDNAR